MTSRATSPLWSIRIPMVLVLSTGLVVGGLVLLYPGTISILGAELTWHVSALLIFAAVVMLIRDYKLQWSYILSPTKRVKRRMDEEYSKTEEGREEEERLENIIERVDEGFGNVPIASPPYYVQGRTVIRVSFSPEFAPWHWKLARCTVDLCLGGFNRRLLPERFCKWICGRLGWTWKD